MGIGQRECPDKRFLWCFVNKRFQNCCSYPARYCVLCDDRMSRRQANPPAQETRLTRQVSTRGCASEVCAEDAPHGNQTEEAMQPEAARPESLTAAGNPVSSEPMSLGHGQKHQAGSGPGCPGKHAAGPASSNPPPRSGQLQGSQDTSSASDSDCVVVSTGNKVSAKTMSAAQLFPAQSLSLPDFTMSKIPRLRKAEGLRMRPKFSNPKCPTTAKGRPAAAKQLKAEIKALQNSSTPYYQSSLPGTQRVSVQDLECLAPSQWLPSGVLNTYLSILQARHAEESASTVHIFSTFFFSKLLEGVTLDVGADQGDPDWSPGRRKSRRKRKGKQAPAPPPKRMKAAHGDKSNSSIESKAAATSVAEQHMHEVLTVNYDAVRSWTAKTRPLQNSDILVVPVNESNSHWLTVVICVSRKEIVLLDSLFGAERSEEYRRILLKVWAWMLLEASDKSPPQFWEPSRSCMPSATELKANIGTSEASAQPQRPQNGAHEVSRQPNRVGGAAQHSDISRGTSRTGEQAIDKRQRLKSHSHDTVTAADVTVAAPVVSTGAPEPPSVQPSSQTHVAMCYSDASPGLRRPESHVSGATAPTYGSQARDNGASPCSNEATPHANGSTRGAHASSQAHSTPHRRAHSQDIQLQHESEDHVKGCGGGGGACGNAETGNGGHIQEQQGLADSQNPVLNAGDISESIGDGGWLQGWRLRAIEGVPQQRDGGSCGVYSLAFTDCVMRGWWPPNFTSSKADTKGSCSETVRGNGAASTDLGKQKSKKKGSRAAAEGSKGACEHVSQCSKVQEMHESQGRDQQPVWLEFGEVPALRLGLLQELTGRQ